MCRGQSPPPLAARSPDSGAYLGGGSIPFAHREEDLLVGLKDGGSAWSRVVEADGRAVHDVDQRRQEISEQRVTGCPRDDAMEALIHFQEAGLVVQVAAHVFD